MSSIEHCYLQTITPEALLNDKVVSRTKPDEIQILVCCVLYLN